MKWGQQYFPPRVNTKINQDNVITYVAQYSAQSKCPLAGVVIGVIVLLVCLNKWVSGVIYNREDNECYS